MGSNEALGSLSDQAKSSLKTNSKLSKGAEELGKLFGDAAKGPDVGSGSKRKRFMLSEEDVLVFTCVTDVVNNIADEIRSTKVDEVHPDLYGAIMLMPEFTEESLIVTFSHLVDNKAHGTAFVGMSHSHRVLWLRTYLAKNYYM
jgi:hypothetical protein